MSNFYTDFIEAIDSCSVSASPPPGPITKLPPELILRALELAAAWGSTFALKERIAVLRTTSLVCKDWTGPSQLLLLRQVYINLDGPHLPSLLAAIDRKEKWVCDKIVVSGGSVKQAYDLLKRAESVGTLKLLHLVAHGGWFELFNLNALQNLTELNLDGVADMLSGAEFGAGLTHLRKLNLDLVSSSAAAFGGKRDDSAVQTLVAAAADSLEHLSFGLTLRSHAAALAPVFKSSKCPKLDTLGLADGGLPLDSGVSDVVNACTTIKTLMLVSANPSLQDEILRRLNPEIKLDNLTINLKGALWDSTAWFTNWLELPAFEGVKVLKIKGSRYKGWRGYRGGEGIVALAMRKGIAEVNVKWG